MTPQDTIVWAMLKNAWHMMILTKEALGMAINRQSLIMNLAVVVAILITTELLISSALIKTILENIGMYYVATHMMRRVL
jgi:hypothetical protein